MKILISLGVIICFTFVCYSQDVNKRLEVGIAFYMEKNYSAAIEIFDSIRKVNSDLYTHYSSLFYLADSYSKIGQHEKAIENHLFAISIIKSIKGEQSIEQANNYSNLAIEYQETNKYECAINYFIKALHISRILHVDQNIGTINLLYLIGDLYNIKQNNDSAIYFLKDCIALNEKIESTDSRSYCSVLNELGEIYLKLNRFKEAEAVYLKIKQKLGNIILINDPLYHKCLNNQAIIYSELGELKKAYILAQECLIVMKQNLGEKNSNYLISLQNLSKIYIDLGDNNKAEKIELELLRLKDNILDKNDPHYLSSLNDLGVIYLRVGDYKKAEYYLTSYLELEKSGHGIVNHDYAVGLGNIAQVYSGLGNYEKAEQFQIESIRISVKINKGDSCESLSSLNSLAYTYSLMGNFKKAQLIYLKCCLIYQKNPDLVKYAAYIENNLAMTYFYLGDYKQAEKLVLLSMSTGKKVFQKNYPDYESCLNNLAKISVAQGKSKIAIKLYLQCKLLLEKKYGIQYPNNIQCTDNLAMAYLRIGKIHSAVKLLLSNRDFYHKEIFHNFSFLNEIEKNLYLQSSTSNFEVLNSVYFQEFAKIDSMQTYAYDDALALKGIVLQSDELVRNSIVNSSDTALFDKYEEFTGTRQILSKLYTLPIEKRWANTDSLEEVANSLEKEFTRIVNDLPGFEGHNGLKVKWHNVQSKLKENEAAIEFINFNYWNKHWTDSTLYCALVIRKNSTHPEMVYLFDERQLDSITNVTGYGQNLYVTRGTTVFENPGSTIPNATKLYNLVWKPIEKYLAGIKTVYFSPSGKLYQIAFSALPIDSVNLLSDKYDLHLISSTRQLVFDKENLHKPSITALFGGINYDANEVELRLSASQDKNDYTFASRSLPSDTTLSHSTLPYLQGSLTETSTIKQLMDSCKINSHQYIGNEASEESFKALSGQKPGIIHIATHGFFFPDVKQKRNDLSFTEFDTHFSHAQNPLLRSGLFLAGANLAWANNHPIEGLEDGILTAYEISQMNLTGTDLVVLSACETGLGEIKGSEGVFGLQRAFKMAGVKTIIMSLWKVPDQQTSELMVSFYKNWLAGQTKHEAFCYAQKEIRNKYPAPYYWAGFVMVD